MPATLRSLIDGPGLGLRLLSAERELRGDTLNAAVTWVHSSDLVDPTPFLSAAQVLLTTGTHFPPDGPGTAGFYRAYVERLSAHGIAALGFGTDVIREGTPVGLVRACHDRNLPLFEVPYRTPFIAVARFAADLAAKDRYARETWALNAQRAISLAAIRPDGLSATLAELSHQLGCWVALFDLSGALDRVFPEGELSVSTTDGLHGEVLRLLHSRRRSSASVTVKGETLTLQTVGEQSRLRGVLALGSSERDRASDQVVTSVIALASLALEQNHALDRARGHLRSGLLHMLLNGEHTLVADIAAQMWGELPRAPICVAVLQPTSEALDAVVEQLEVRAGSTAAPIFYAVDEGRIILCAGKDDDTTARILAESFPLNAGISTAIDYEHLRDGINEATLALDDARTHGPAIAMFESVADRGMFALVGGADARALARALLRPLLDHDASEGSALLETVRVWLQCNGQFEAAAAALGVHRHTVRARVGQAERLLGRSLLAFSVRAELWAAMVSLGAEVSAVAPSPAS